MPENINYCSYFALYGIRDVAKEVDAPALYKTAKTSIPLSFVFLVYAAFEFPFMSEAFGTATYYIYFALLLSVVVFIISNLVTVYKAYMQICMPEDLEPKVKKSKFEFVEKFREYESAYGQNEIRKQGITKNNRFRPSLKPPNSKRSV
jgi:hypothetical protein